ncbi:TIGR03089 family protein [Phycicoccus flavus]|uniref:TIGR03089 family protein n=1 Tax=Phycicoccus flavus TaxID=2502783 RepID=UPI000FEBDEA7|nr:TIGR03089 family protein [Phycicoccus flavus]NHA68004.1 TIGR03089 family protein [Phycicoccus flavus]
MTVADSAAALLARMMAADPGRPRITVYDDTDGPTAGERVELSARVFANWVAKAANLLQDELDAEPGRTVRVDLPPHWRTAYWAFAAWSVGASVVVPGAGDGTDGGGDTGDTAADVLVTDDPDTAAATDAEHVVLVTLAALARSATGPVPAGAVDEAHEVATHGDVFVPLAEPDPAAPALLTRDGRRTFADLVPTGTGGRVHTGTVDTGAFLDLLLEVWAGDGSVVLTRGAPEPEVLAARLTSEGVTRDG